MDFTEFMLEIQKTKFFIPIEDFATNINENTIQSQIYPGFSQVFEWYVDIWMKTSLKKRFKKDTGQRREIFQKQHHQFWWFCIEKAFHNSQKCNSQLK